MKYKIFQFKDIKKIAKEKGYEFMGYSYATSHGFDLNDYEIVYEGEIEEENVNIALEKLFNIFNVNHPGDFTGHSLSVSDIVEIDSVKYYCDMFDWVKI